MQADFNYIQSGCYYAAKLWTEQGEAVEQANVLSNKTALQHGPKALGDLGWLCVQAQPTVWFDACDSVLVPPRHLLEYQQLRQGVRECRVHLELDYVKALAQVRKSWTRLNPRKLSKPQESDYAEAALITVFMLDRTRSAPYIHKGVHLLFEQGFNEIPSPGQAETMSQNLAAWWNKNIATA